MGVFGLVPEVGKVEGDGVVVKDCGRVVLTGRTPLCTGVWGVGVLVDDAFGGCGGWIDGGEWGVNNEVILVVEEILLCSRKVVVKHVGNSTGLCK